MGLAAIFSVSRSKLGRWSGAGLVLRAHGTSKFEEKNDGVFLQRVLQGNIKFEVKAAFKREFAFYSKLVLLEQSF